MTLQKKHRHAKQRGSVIDFVSRYKKVG